MTKMYFAILFAVAVINDAYATTTRIIQSTTTDIPPSGYERVPSATTYDWCDCGEDGNVVVGGVDVVEQNTTAFVQFEEPQGVVSWSCGQSTRTQTSKMSDSYEFWSLQVTTEKKPLCGKATSRLRYIFYFSFLSPTNLHTHTLDGTFGENQTKR